MGAGRRAVRASPIHRRGPSHNAIINGTLQLVEPGDRGVGNLCLVNARPAGSGTLGFASLLGGPAGEVCFRAPPARHVANSIANVRVKVKPGLEAKTRERRAPPHVAKLDPASFITLIALPESTRESFRRRAL